MLLQGENILYITSEWSGLTDIFKKEEPRGMPAFFNTLNGLSIEGANVRIIVFSESLKTGVIKIQLNSYRYVAIILPWELKAIKKPFVLLKNIYRVFFITKKINPSFIYSLGVAGYIGKIPSILLKIPIGVRLFGINKYYKLYTEIKKIRFLFHSPLLFSIFYFKSNFILATDDGSKADELFKCLGNKNTNFYFWKNGYDSNLKFNNNRSIQKNPYIFYPARIASKKQQIKAVDLLKKLLDNGYNSVNLKLAGHITDKKYYKDIIIYASKIGIEHKIEYCGVLEKEKLFSYMNEALVVLSLQKISNLGNTTIEALNSKSVLLSFKEPSLEEFLQNKKSAILVTNMNDAVDEIGTLLNDPDYDTGIRKNGYKALTSYLKSWEQRISEEIDLIKLTLS